MCRRAVLALAFLLILSCPAFAALAIPTLIAPGAAYTTPTFYWQAVPRSTWYYVWVNDPAGRILFRRWYTQEQTGCVGGGTCKIAPGVAMPDGHAYWWIQAWNAAEGYGPWSAAKLMRVDRRFCDTSYEDCRAVLLRYIDRETQGIDVALWFIEDWPVTNALIRAHRRGVDVRILMNRRASYGQTATLHRMADAGIPMRHKASAGMFHPKAMIFAGQRTLELSGANFTYWALLPHVPFVNYTDEVVSFLTDPRQVESAMREFDDQWTNRVDFGNFANAPEYTLGRRYPLYGKDRSWVPRPSFFGRTLDAIWSETVQIDIVMYRMTHWPIWDALIQARARGVRVNVLTDPISYYQWATQGYPSPYNHVVGVNELRRVGGTVKMRVHQGLNHEKLALFYSQSRMILGSQNYVYDLGPVQEWNVDLEWDGRAYWWGRAHFDRKWTTPAEFR